MERREVEGAGMKRTQALATAAEHSVGSRETPESVRLELKNLPGDMDACASRMDELL